MKRITIYLDDHLAAAMKSAAKRAGASQSEWIADAIRQRDRKEWPKEVLDLVGAWPDFPTIEEIRKTTRKFT